LSFSLLRLLNSTFSGGAASSVNRSLLVVSLGKIGPAKAKSLHERQSDYLPRPIGVNKNENASTCTISVFLRVGPLLVIHSPYRKVGQASNCRSRRAELKSAASRQVLFGHLVGSLQCGVGVV
jgi:hypothetical protein